MRKARRVLKSQEFQQIMNKKRFASSPSLVVYVKEKKENISRIGISVGKRVGNAVMRNKCKRQLRMMLDELIPITDDRDYIILARADYFDYSYADNKKQLERLLQKIKIKGK